MIRVNRVVPPLPVGANHAEKELLTFLTPGNGEPGWHQREVLPRRIDALACRGSPEWELLGDIAFPSHVSFGVRLALIVIRRPARSNPDGDWGVIQRTIG